MKNITILGSTGSIGTQTLEVVDKLDDYNILGLSCGRNIELLIEQIKKYNPRFVCVENKEDVKKIESFFPKLTVFFGSGGLVELARCKECDIFVVATNGVVALKATIEALKNKKRVALANKETLVMAGDIVIKTAQDNGVEIIPIDSEHSAILQCLNNFNNNYAKRLWITASGGPFLNNSREEMKNFNAKDALNHPRWSMGRKITVDCSTLVNKGLEVIEAHHLFNFDYNDIEVVIHPQSIVHSMVEFVDGSFLAQMGLASMHIPIQFALTYPKRLEGIKTDSFNIFNKNLEFLKPDNKKFPLLNLTIETGRQKGILSAVLNAANEVAVYKFLQGKINFLDIEKIVFREVETTNNIQNPTLDEILEVDRYTREKLNKDLA